MMGYRLVWFQKRLRGGVAFPVHLRMLPLLVLLLFQTIGLGHVSIPGSAARLASLSY